MPMLRVFLTPQVARLARKERLADAAFCRVAEELVLGRLGSGEADLGGGLFKKRMARGNEGKSGGFRMIVAYRKPGTDRILFLYGFAKNAASTLAPDGEKALGIAAAAFIAGDAARLARLLAAGDVTEVMCHGQAA